MKHTYQELFEWQQLPLDIKILMTKERIRNWVNEYGIDGVYISFSGGKDSTVLLSIAREMYPDIKAMFVDVPTQYPELKQFVIENYENVDIVKPKMSYMQVVEKYGFPLINKEISRKFYELESAMNHGKTDSYVLHQLNGDYVSKNGKKNLFNVQNYKYLLDAPFSISHMCCFVFKKNPSRQYSKDTGRLPITAQMAQESMLRTQAWLKNGCNAFDAKHPISNPMSFWTGQDILWYIKKKNLPVCSVYGEVVYDYDADGQLEGQLSILDSEEYKSIDNRPLKTTGCDRTGCVLCGFGSHCKGDTRFVDLKSTHPGLYGLLDKVQNNGVTMREAINWLNEHGDMDIKL